METMAGINIKKLCIKTVLLLVSAVYLGESSHLLSPRTSSDRFLNIQERVMQSCKGHFFCEVFPYYNSYGLNCLDINDVCDGTRQCRDGSDEHEEMCASFRRTSGANGTSSNTPEVARNNEYRETRIIRTETANDSAVLGRIVATMRINTEGNEQLSGDQAQGQAQRRGFDINDVNANTPPTIQNEVVTYPSLNQIPETNLGMETVTPPAFLREQRPLGSMSNRQSRFMQGNNPLANGFGTPLQNMQAGINPITNRFGMPLQNMQADNSPFANGFGRQLQNMQRGNNPFANGFGRQLQNMQRGNNPLANSYGMPLQNMQRGNNPLANSYGMPLQNMQRGNNPLANSYGMPLQNMQRGNNPLANTFGMRLQNMQAGQRPSVVDYYNAQRRVPNIRSDRNTNTLPFRGQSGMNFGFRQRRQSNRPNAGFARQFMNRQMSVPGSSYIDTPVSTPPPQIPDGFVYRPGNEPYLSQEQQFLEQQFYLTNLLHGPAQQQNTRRNTGQSGSLTEQERLAIQIGQARQEQLLRQQSLGPVANIGTTDASVERYDLMGPFDGGVPSVPGEVQAMNAMEGKEAQGALHNVEALQ